MANKKVTVIPARKSIINPICTNTEKRRVSAYARVSTDMDEQLNSYEAQISYYTQHIKENPEWQFVKVYTDEGVSGLMTKKTRGLSRDDCGCLVREN